MLVTSFNCIGEERDDVVDIVKAEEEKKNTGKGSSTTVYPRASPSRRVAPRTLSTTEYPGSGALALRT